MTRILHNELSADEIISTKAKITIVQDVASYNWIKASGPTIIVPGVFMTKWNREGKIPNESTRMTRKWTPSTRTTPLAEDNPKDTYYRGPNAAYFPTYPMEPVCPFNF